jgi:hypothetical protein
VVVFPLRSWEQRPGRWEEEKVRRGERSWSHYLAAGERTGVHVTAFESPGPARWYGRVDGNPARWVDPEGIGVCPADQVVEVAAAMVGCARELVEPAALLEEMSVTRLDVARDFQVSDAGYYVRGLQHIPRPFARRNFVHNDPKHGGAQTLDVGSGAGTTMLYDKHQESPKLAPPGRLRWECEAHRGWLARYGNVVRLRDVHEETVQSLAENRWRWSQMGADISAANVVLEKVQRARLSSREQLSFLGWMVAQSTGVHVPVSKQATAKYRRLQRELGVSMEPGAMAGTFLARLDFETGTEVLRVA